MTFILTLGLFLALVIILRQQSYRRPALLICLFSLLPLLISPLLLPEFSSQFPSLNRLGLHSWQLSNLSLFLALAVFGLYYRIARRYITPAVHPDRWKLAYTIVGSVVFFILVTIQLPILYVLVFSIVLNIAIITFLRRQLLVDMFFAGISLGLLYILIALAAHFFFPSPFDDLWLGQNTAGITLVGLPITQIIILMLLGFLWGPFYLGIKEPYKTPDGPPFEHHHLNLKRTASLSFLFILVTLTTWVSFHYVWGPQKVQANLDSSDNVSLNKEISLTFSRPIDRTSVRFHISPEIEGQWDLRETSLGDRVFNTVAFKPQEYFLPKQVYTIQIEDIRTIIQTKQGNYTYSFQTEPIPGIENVRPATDSTQIAACDPIVVTFTNSLDSYWRPEFKIEPEAQFSTTQNGAEYILDTQNCLEQGTNYILTVYNRLENATTGDVTPLSTTRFQTKQAPGLTDHAPEGSGILISTNQIEMTFNQPMKTDDVNQYAAISPSPTGTWKWDEGGLKLRYLLSGPLTYNTRYTITLKKGLPDQNKGFLAEDTSFSFTTIGAVSVSLNTPSSGSREVAVDISMQIQFNQAVDHTSAEERFSIDPNIPGTFSWKNNVLTFRPNSSLAYSTNYTVRMKAGVKSVHGLDLARDFSAAFTTKYPPPVPITFGFSEKGRAINGYKFGSGSEVIFLFGAIHGGKEKSTSLLMNTFVQELGKDTSQVASNKTIIIVPIANPDGYIERTDKLNSRGVNLNRNFDTSNWTETGWDTEGSIGTEPFSEKESQVIRDIVQKYNVKSMLAYHSQGGFTNPEYGHAPSQQLALWYANQTGYGYYQDIGWNFPGTATRWFVEQYGGAGVTIELVSHTVPDWTRHKKALFGLVK